MSRVKAIKVKKLTNLKIWPSVVGLILAMCIFQGLLMAFLMIYGSSIYDSKMTQGKGDVEKINAMINLSADDNSARYWQLQQIMSLVNNVEGICILDSSGNKVEQCGQHLESFDDMIEVTFMLDDISNLKMYLNRQDLEELGMSVNSDGQLKDKDMFVPFIKTLREKESIALIFRSLSDESFGLNCWYALKDDVTGRTLCVAYHFGFYNNDFIYAFLMAGLIFVICIAFMIYQIACIVRLVKNKKQLFELMYTDVVTGGRNLTFFYKKANRLIKKNKGPGEYAVVHIRLEKYRGLCNCYGIAAVEDIVEDFYKLLQKHISKKEIAVHHEQGDFALLLAYTDDAILEGRVSALTKRMAGIYPDRKFYFNVGICRADNKHEANVLYLNAQTARSAAIDDNAGAIIWFSKKMLEEQIWERKVENEMERAIENREFEMYLQPKYSTVTEKISGAEALVRWNHPDDGLIPPYKFIPIFEKNGFIIQLDDYMIDSVARQQAKWLSEGKALVPISVNVSRAHFMKEDLAEHIKEIVDKYNVPYEVIELELTESAFFDDKNVLIEIVKRMREYGFKVSMDDFGSGYSSLNSLKEIPLDVVKLDAEFFRGANGIERGRLIVSQTISLSKKLGLEIVAEGIETRDQVDFLANESCDLIQGYYFAKPMPVKDFEEKTYGGEKVIENSEVKG